MHAPLPANTHDLLNALRELDAGINKHSPGLRNCIVLWSAAVAKMWKM